MQWVRSPISSFVMEIYFNLIIFFRLFYLYFTINTLKWEWKRLKKADTFISAFFNNTQSSVRISFWGFQTFSFLSYHPCGTRHSTRLVRKWNTPQQATGHHSLNAQQAAGYCTLAAVAKVMQAWLWLVARGNKVVTTLVSFFHVRAQFSSDVFVFWRFRCLK